MNKLKTDIIGGFPFVLDDLRWVDDGIREAIEGIISMVPGDYILSGCEWSQVDQTITFNEGFIVYKGEVLYFPEQSITYDENNALVFYLFEDWDIDGNKVFQSTESHDTYQIRQARLQYVTPENIGVMLPAFTAKTIIEKLVEEINDLEEDWTYPTLNSPWTSADNANRSRVAYKKDQQGNVFLRGHAICNEVTEDEIFQLPTGYRPERKMYFITSYILEEVTHLIIDSDGSVKTAGGVNTSFDGVIFKAV